MPSLVMGTRAGGTCPDGTCWRSGGGGRAYKDRTGTSSGITLVQLRAKATRVKLQVKGKGVSLPMPTLPFVKDPSVRAELHRRAVGAPCWTSRFRVETTNTSERFKAKSE